MFRSSAQKTNVQKSDVLRHTTSVRRRTAAAQGSAGMITRVAATGTALRVRIAAEVVMATRQSRQVFARGSAIDGGGKDLGIETTRVRKSGSIGIVRETGGGCGQTALERDRGIGRGIAREIVRETGGGCGRGRVIEQRGTTVVTSPLREPIQTKRQKPPNCIPDWIPTGARGARRPVGRC